MPLAELTAFTALLKKGNKQKVISFFIGKAMPKIDSF
jgi:hypothetical protein